MKYTEITFQDKNPIKRWLQQQRLVSALRAIRHSSCSPSVICDFGAGNGELCKQLADRYPSSKIICYEPALGLLNEAKENLKEVTNVSFVDHLDAISVSSVDIVFSLEVFEHLPPEETNSALEAIQIMLHPDGELIIGVPVEIGLPALYKGAFRMVRRFGAFDANFKNVFMSFLGNPPSNRPIGEIAPGRNYYFEHIGFDHRNLAKNLRYFFSCQSTETSPLPFFGAWLMPEINFIVKKS